MITTVPNSPGRKRAAEPTPATGWTVALLGVNAVAALGLVLSFSRLGGVSLGCAVGLLAVTGVGLAVAATLQSLNDATRPDQRGSIADLLMAQWPLFRDGSPPAHLSEPAGAFAASIQFACLYVGFCFGLGMVGVRSWPPLSPYVDVLGAILGATVLFKVASGGHLAPEPVLGVAKRLLVSPRTVLPTSAPLRLALLVALVLYTAGYGLAVSLPLAMALDLPIVPVFVLHSLLPAAVFGFTVAVLLAPTQFVADSSGTALPASDGGVPR